MDELNDDALSALPIKRRVVGVPRPLLVIFSLALGLLGGALLDEAGRPQPGCGDRLAVSALDRLTPRP